MREGGRESEGGKEGGREGGRVKGEKGKREDMHLLRPRKSCTRTTWFVGLLRMSNSILRLTSSLGTVT